MISLDAMSLLDAVVIEDTQDFAALEEEWEDLYRNSPLATPFQSWAWLYSWWEAYGEGYELRLVAIREAGLLVGLIPLMLERRWSFGRLLFIGTGITDYLDMLAREGSEGQVVEVGAQALRRMDSWHIADLQELHPEAAAWILFGKWAGPKIFLRQSSCAEIEVESWEELLMSLRQNVRRVARQSLRRARKDGIRSEPAPPEDAAEAAERLIRLHREQWRGRSINPEHLSRRFARHLEAAAHRMTSHGLGGVYEFWRNSEVVASHFLVLGRSFVGGYLNGSNEGIRRRLQVAALYNHDLAKVALERDARCLSLLRGEEPYKLRWNPKVVANHRVILARNRASFAPYVGYYALRSRAAAYAKSEDASAWVKTTVDRLKGYLPA